jgi:transglutaminase-like putative cysteine protease
VRRLALLLALGLHAQALARPFPGHAWLDVADRVELGAALDPEVERAIAEPLAQSVGRESAFAEALLRARVHLRADGIVEEERVQVRRFLSDSGAQMGGNLVFEVASLQGRAAIARAQVVSADGRRHAVEPSTVQVVNGPRSDLFSDTHAVVVPYPALAPGAVAVLALRLEWRQRDWPLPWSLLRFARGQVPLARFVLDVEWDESVAAPVWAADPAIACATSGERRLRCAASELEPIPNDPEVETWWDLLPQVVVAEPSRWSELARREGDLVERQARETPAILAAARRLVDGAADPAARLERIHRFVADEVRYVGLEHGRAAVEPRAAHVTLKRRYGDCKDMVTLFVALARAVGLRARPVLVASELRDPARLLAPSWKYFDHMIACVGGVENEPVCLDLTAPGLPTGTLPLGVQGRVALDLEPETAAPRVLPRESHPLRVDVESEIDVGCDGAIRTRTQREFRGNWGPFLRARLLGLRDSERRRFAEEEARDALGRDATFEVTVDLQDEPSDPVRMTVVSTTPMSGSLETARRWIDWDEWLLRYGRDLATKNRHHPYTLKGLRYRARHRYHVCERLRPTQLGPQLLLQSGFGRLYRSYRLDGTDVTVSTTLEARSRDVAGDERERLNRFVERALAQTRIWFALAPAP